MGGMGGIGNAVFFHEQAFAGCKKAVLTTPNRHFDQAKQAFQQRKKGTVSRIVKLSYALPSSSRLLTVRVLPQSN